MAPGPTAGRLRPSAHAEQTAGASGPHSMLWGFGGAPPPPAPTCSQAWFSRPARASTGHRSLRSGGLTSRVGVCCPPTAASTLQGSPGQRRAPCWYSTRKLRGTSAMAGELAGRLAAGEGAGASVIRMGKRGRGNSTPAMALASARSDHRGVRDGGQRRQDGGNHQHRQGAALRRPLRRGRAAAAMGITIEQHEGAHSLACMPGGSRNLPPGANGRTCVRAKDARGSGRFSAPPRAPLGLIQVSSACYAARGPHRPKKVR
jgi:hypothetical protein